MSGRGRAAIAFVIVVVLGLGLALRPRATDTSEVATFESTVGEFHFWLFFFNGSIGIDAFLQQG